MRETCEFRISEKFAGELLDKNEGKVMGDNWIRLIELDMKDTRFQKIGQLQRETLKKYGKPFFYGWKINRYYSDAELLNADILHMNITSFINSAGEDCGTTYNEIEACSVCGAGAIQDSDLQIELNKIPIKNDISRTIAGEIVVSRRLVDLLIKKNVSGVTFGSIYACHNTNILTNDFSELFFEKSDIEIIPPTKTGINPFDEDTKGCSRCPEGDLIGHAQLSEFWVKKLELNDLEFRTSRQYLGVRRGLLRPQRALFISSQLWHLFKTNNIKGFKVEVANFR